MNEAENYQEIDKFIKQLDRLVNDKFAVRQMLSGGREIMEKIRDDHNAFMEGCVEQMVPGIRAAAQALDEGQRVLDLENRVTNNAYTFKAEIGRRAALEVAAEGGHESVIRSAYSSDDPLVQDSFKEVVKSEALKGKSETVGSEEVFKGSQLAIRAPHIANLEVDDDGNVGELEDVDWLGLGLGAEQLEQISIQSALDMERWFANKLQKARSDRLFRQNMKGYSSNYIERAAENTKASNPELARILGQIATAVKNLSD